MADSQPEVSADDFGAEADDVDELCDALSHRYRRHALAAVSRRDGPVRIADLARDVADRAAGPAGASAPTERVRRVRAELYHVHVPKLADAGLVEFDADRNAVAPAEDDAPADVAVESLLP